MKLLLLFTTLLLCGCSPSITVNPGDNSTPNTIRFSAECSEATLFFYETNGVRLAVLVGDRKCAIVQIK